MQCPRCETENALGATYCAGCGAKLEISDVEAQAHALAAVRHENWKKTFASLNRALFLSVLIFVGALLFDAYATRDVAAEFTAGAPLPPPPLLGLTPSFIEQPRLPMPPLFAAAHTPPDKDSEVEILSELAATARDRLNCTIFHKRRGIIRGILLSRTDRHVRVITPNDWGPPIKPQTIDISEIDMARSRFPQ